MPDKLSGLQVSEELTPTSRRSAPQALAGSPTCRRVPSFNVPFDEAESGEKEELGAADSDAAA